MKTTTAAVARTHLASLLRRVQVPGERITITRNGKPVAALVGVQDLLLLEALEDRMDLDSMRRALEDGRPSRWEDVKARLGLA